jgi:predicted ATPase
MGFPGWYLMGSCMRGEALAMLGRAREGIDLLQEHIAANETLGARCYIPGALRALAEAQARVGQIENACATVAGALDFVERTGERHWEAELHRVHGQLLLAQKDERRAEESLQKAVGVARQQGAKSWELRATTDLARLWQAQGKAGQAYQALREVYAWFSEGFDTPDLQQAEALLEELA